MLHILTALVLVPAKFVQPAVTQRAWLDVSVGGVPAGRLTFGLFGVHCPKTVENFLGFVNGVQRKPAARFPGKRLELAGSKFHRVIPGFMAQVRFL